MIEFLTLFIIIQIKYKAATLEDVNRSLEQLENFSNIKLSIFQYFFQTITLDGGEFRSLAGEFNKLREVPKEAWDMIEQMIRSTNKKSKV